MKRFEKSLESNTEEFQIARKYFIESFFKHDVTYQKNLFEIYYSAYGVETVRKIVKSAEKEYNNVNYWKERYFK